VIKISIDYRIALLIAAFLLGVGIVAAQGPECVGANCAYLATVKGAVAQDGQPTATIGPTAEVPRPCQPAPPPAEGAQVWVVRQGREGGAICARLIVAGRTVNNIEPRWVIHRRSTDEMLPFRGQYNIYGSTSWVDGYFAEVGARYGETVDVDVAIPYLTHTYVARTTVPIVEAPTPDLSTATPTMTSTPTKTATPTETSMSLLAP
jgi:hypothetical protein